MLGVAQAGLVPAPKVEVEADVGVVCVGVVGGRLDGQNVERHHHSVDGNQHRLAPLVNLYEQHIQRVEI